MPEGDTIYRAARTLHRGLAEQKITTFQSVLPALTRVEIDSGVVGRTVENVEAQGKWMLIRFSGDLILLSHMLMSGSWHIYRPGEKWRRPKMDMRVVLGTDAILAVGFKVPIAEFHTSDSLRRRPGFNRLGPSVLKDDFSATEALQRLRSRPELEVGVALLAQSVVAGIGNVFKSEICFACGVNPFRTVNSLSMMEAASLIATARRFMSANITSTSGDQIVTYTGIRRTTGRSEPRQNLWVYGRRREPCRKCSTPIESFKQGEEARTSFWCPQCQPIGTGG